MPDTVPGNEVMCFNSEILATDALSVKPSVWSRHGSVAFEVPPWLVQRVLALSTHLKPNPSGWENVNFTSLPLRYCGAAEVCHPPWFRPSSEELQPLLADFGSGGLGFKSQLSGFALPGFLGP